jgi:death on curing protein
MRYLTVTEVWKLHDLAIDRMGGSYGLEDRSSLELSVERPQNDIQYPSLVEKAAALWWYLSGSKPFIDGNTIAADAAMEAFLMLNGWKINASVDERKQVMLEVSDGNLKREDLIKWLTSHVRPQGA